MYPIFRMAYQYFRVKRMEPIGPFDLHVSHHICMPWDIDIFMELNNGRVLTLNDLTRIPLALRAGLGTALLKNRWALTVAGVSVQYRKRVRVFDRIEIHARLLGWDSKFFYIEQSMWKSNGDCASQAFYRTAVTDRDGIVAPMRVAEAVDVDPNSPTLPPEVEAWAKAEDLRPWPPARH